MSTLTHLALGSMARVVDVVAAPGRRERLAAYGLVRGTVLKLLQARPCIVISMEGTDLALDPKIGEEIRVDSLA